MGTAILTQALLSDPWRPMMVYAGQIIAYPVS